VKEKGDFKEIKYFISPSVVSLFMKGIDQQRKKKTVWIDHIEFQ